MPYLVVLGAVIIIAAVYIYARRKAPGMDDPAPPANGPSVTPNAAGGRRK